LKLSINIQMQESYFSFKKIGIKKALEGMKNIFDKKFEYHP
jgi:hypothetical protein